MTPAAERNADVLIVGAGLAGLAVALDLAPARVIVLAKAPLGSGTATGWAQGGIAAAMGSDDDWRHHADDTVAVGGGINAREVVDTVTAAAPGAIAALRALDVSFDATQDGALVLGREAGHRRARIVHAGGDATGREVLRAFIAAVQAAPTIVVHDSVLVDDLVIEDDTVSGVTAWRDGRYETYQASAVVLATGGIGQLYADTTNPPGATGDGLAMAARAGARLADLEFVQFHPTALATGGDPMPLATEALRGAGATLVDRNGARIMRTVHRDAELAPRDIVARTLARYRQGGQAVFLDGRRLGRDFATRFPTVYAHCRGAGIDPLHDVIPVAPAAHYHMGGVAVDENGRTSLQGLWACGEVAATGFHGANRLASNSLLEALVFAGRIAADVRGYPGTRRTKHAVVPSAAAEHADASVVAALRRLMAARIGIARDERGLIEAVHRFTLFERERPWPTAIRNRLMLGKLIAVAALQRRESRGGHFRSDFPQPVPAFQQRSFLSLDEATQLFAEIGAPSRSRGGLIA